MAQAPRIKYRDPIRTYEELDNSKCRVTQPQQIIWRHKAIIRKTLACKTIEFKLQIPGRKPRQPRVPPISTHRWLWVEVKIREYHAPENSKWETYWMPINGPKISKRKELQIRSNHNRTCREALYNKTAINLIRRLRTAENTEWVPREDLNMLQMDRAVTLKWARLLFIRIQWEVRATFH